MSNASPTDLLGIKVVRQRKAATIYWNPTFSLSEKDLDIVVIHELVHLLVDPMREEHDFQVHYAYLGDRGDECKSRFTRELEKSVETIARAIYNCWNI